MTRNGSSVTSGSRTEKKRLLAQQHTSTNQYPRLFLFLLGLCLFAVTASFGLFHSQNARVAWITTIDNKNITSNNAQFIVDFLFPPSPAGEDDDSQRRHSNDTATATAHAAGTNKNNSSEEYYLNECGNTQAWINSKRHGNLQRDPLFTDDLARSLILNLKNLLASEQQRHAVLGQTLCHADGRFRNDTAAGLDAGDDRTVRLWAVRLIFYALHYHQHRLAVPEAIRRYNHHSNSTSSMQNTSSSCSPETILRQHSVGVFDYECPNAKYIITSLGGNGLGANVRLAAVPALLMGLTSDRIVLFVNNAPHVRQSSRKPWPLASCPRRDYQCFFMPPSPCTLTVDDIARAHELSRPEYRRLAMRSDPLPELQHHKVWTFASPFLPNEVVGPRVVARLQKYAQILVDAMPDDGTPATTNANFTALLRRAVQAIGALDGQRRGTYNFTARWNKIYHALTIYSMRPNPSSARELDKIMEGIVPDHLDPEATFGLPVRASDKCKYESECLSFGDHMRATTQLWGRHLNKTEGGHYSRQHPTVVFTTEAKSMVEEQQSWVKENEPSNKLPVQFDFVVNEQDILPDSGFIKDIVKKNQGMESDPDANMLSSMSSLKLQLLPRVSVGNCCSNFHAMLSDFLLEGCGAARSNTFTCLQELDDPLFRLCCGWHRDCKAKRTVYRTVLENNGTTAEAYAAAYVNAVWDPKTNQLRPIEQKAANNSKTFS